jgi:hypothetical protein
LLRRRSALPVGPAFAPQAAALQDQWDALAGFEQRAERLLGQFAQPAAAERDGLQPAVLRLPAALLRLAAVRRDGQVLPEADLAPRVAQPA